MTLSRQYGYQDLFLKCAPITVHHQNLTTNSEIAVRKHNIGWVEIFSTAAYLQAFSALTPLVGRQEGHPACKKMSGGVLAWLSVWSEVQTCIWPSWCHCHSLSCFSKIQIGFTFLVPAHLGSPGKRAVKWVCVCCIFTKKANLKRLMTGEWR